MSEQTLNINKFVHPEKYPDYQTEELCITACKLNGCLLEYVRHQTPAICKAAVEQDGSAIIFVEDQTLDICKIAIEYSPHMIGKIHNPTLELFDFSFEQATSNYHLEVHLKKFSHELITDILEKYWREDYYEEVRDIIEQKFDNNLKGRIDRMKQIHGEPEKL